MSLTFQPASRKKTKLRMALDGPSGSGKTFSALRFAFALGKKIGVIDTEYGSASKYQGESPDGFPWEFQVLELARFSPLDYIEAIRAAAAAGFDVLVIDSLSHAWAGKDGALEQVDKAASKSKSNNTYFAWRDVTPMHNEMVDAIIRAPMHVIATMRSKMEYVVETDERGKSVPRKIGMAPVQRQGMEYEFDIVGDIDVDHKLIVSKSRCSAVADAVVKKPGPEFMTAIRTWLESGAEVPPEVIEAARIQYQQPTANGNGHSNGHEAAPRKSLKDELAEKKAAQTAKALNALASAKSAADSVIAIGKKINEGTGQQPPAITESAKDDRHEARLRDRATTDQVDNIKDCWRELEPLGVGQDRRAGALRKRGVETESQLSIAQADELLNTLRGKITELSVNKLAEETIGVPAGN